MGTITKKDLEELLDNLPVNPEDFGKKITDRETALEYGGGMVYVYGSQMPPFVQMAWVSEQAKNKWKPRLDRASRTYNILEEYTVRARVRRVYTTHVYPERLPDFAYRLAASGLYFLPLRQVGVYEGFSHYHPPVIEGKPWDYYGVLGDPEGTYLFAKATKEGDHETMGNLLGYPRCCRDFFSQVWTKNYIDPIWQQAINTALEEEDRLIDFDPKKRVVFVKPIPSSLSVLRYIGIRAVPHIPHSVSCRASAAMSRDWYQVAKDYREEIKARYGVDPVEGYELILEFLSWPIKWTVNHGIAEVKTPVFKFATNSVFTPFEYTVMLAKQDDVDLPEETPYGLEFPFKRRAPMFKIDAPIVEEGQDGTTAH